jgi:hypothetical protein
MSQLTNEEIRRQLGPTQGAAQCDHHFVKIAYHQFQCLHCRVVKNVQAAPWGVQ